MPTAPRFRRGPRPGPARARVTVEIEADLLATVTQVAAAQDESPTMRSIIEAGLRMWLEEQRQKYRPGSRE